MRRLIVDIADRLLHNRFLVRAPIPLFRHGLGWIFGNRMLLLEHHGRVSGKPRYVVLEVVERPDPLTYRVISGLGDRSQWLLNLRADPRAYITVGRHPRREVHAVIHPGSDTAAVVDRYAKAHPSAWKTLSEVMQRSRPAGASGYEDFPVVDLILTHGGAEADC